MRGPQADGGTGPGLDPVVEVRRWLGRHGVRLEEETVQSNTWMRRAGATSGGPRPDRPAPAGPGVSLVDAAVERGPGQSEAGEPDADPEEVARGIVLRKLAAQARTRSELAKALQARAVPAEAASVVLDRMSEIGLVDDAAFAQDWVASRQQRRHLSRSALRRELQNKGVARDQIDEALAPLGVSEELEAALSLARRRQATMATLPRDVQYRRLSGVLARRGFGGSVAAQVLEVVLAGVSEDRLRGEDGS